VAEGRLYIAICAGKDLVDKLSPGEPMPKMLAGVKEVSQLHWRDMFVPKQYSDLTDDEKKKVLRSAGD
jgi:hypothetical protein